MDDDEDLDPEEMAFYRKMMASTKVQMAIVTTRSNGKLDELNRKFGVRNLGKPRKQRIDSMFTRFVGEGKQDAEGNNE